LGRECVTIGFASKGGHYLVYAFLQPIISYITKMQLQQSLTLRGRSFSGWGRDRVTVVFAIQGSQYFIDVCLQSIATSVTKDGTPTIVDSWLTVMFRMGE